MSQSHRIAQFDDIERILEQVRSQHEVEAADVQPPVEDRVEQNRTAYLPDGPAQRVDLHGAMTRNLAVGPLNPERLGRSKNGAGRIVVKAEARSTDYQGLPPRAEAEARAEAARPRVQRRRSAPADNAPAPPTEQPTESALPGWLVEGQGFSLHDHYVEPTPQWQEAVAASPAAAQQTPPSAEAPDTPTPPLATPESNEVTGVHVRWSDTELIQRFAADVEVQGGEVSVRGLEPTARVERPDRAEPTEVVRRRRR